MRKLMESEDARVAPILERTVVAGDKADILGLRDEDAIDVLSLFDAVRVSGVIFNITS